MTILAPFMHLRETICLLWERKTEISWELKYFHLESSKDTVLIKCFLSQLLSLVQGRKKNQKQKNPNNNSFTMTYIINPKHNSVKATLVVSSSVYWKKWSPAKTLPCIQHHTLHNSRFLQICEATHIWSLVFKLKIKYKMHTHKISSHPLHADFFSKKAEILKIDKFIKI